MTENVFEAVKQSVSTRDAAAFYGIEVKRNGMACCPFHDDKNPSMKVDQRFHCFGCGEDGDVIDFTAKLFDLSPKEAAEKLAQDFGLIYDSQATPRRRYVRQKTEAQKFREDRQRCYRVLSDYYHLLKKWGIDHSPRTPEEEPHPRFVEAIQKKTYVEYLLDLFLYESEEEQRASMKELDGGQLDMPELSRKNAVLQICDDNNLDSTSLRHAPMSMIETLQEAAYQQMQAEASQMTASAQLPEAQEQALDEYPMPDEQVSTPDMQEYGYFYDGMLPVTRERALELDAAGLTVYVLHEDNTESMVFDSQEIMEHGGFFGVDREEWEKSPQFHEKVMERQEHQREREQAFLAQNRDCFAIYQVSRDDPQNVRFMNLDWLKSHDISIERSNYDLIYTAPLRESGTVPEQLEKLYEQFNLQKPADFHSPSMSVSDIVAIKQDGKVSYHYCDSVGFTQIPGFLPENPLKNAEMAVEDDYGMIDGIINNGAKEPTVAELEQQARSGQPISLMELAAATHREEREKKKSVMEQLKGQPKTEHKKTAPKKSAEREI